MIEADNKAMRKNEGKPIISLVPPEQILALAQHFTVGANKYEKHNWLRGMDWSRCYDSMQRHALAWAKGEDFDEETGTHHMVSAAWNALALYSYYVRNLGADDRLKLEVKYGRNSNDIQEGIR